MPERAHKGKPAAHRKILGVCLIVLGAVLHLIPLFPAGWIIVLGCEMSGVGLLLRDRIKGWLGRR